MSIEVKGLINGVIAATVALVLVFGLAAILKPKNNESFSPKQNQASGSNGVQGGGVTVVEAHALYSQYCARCHGAQGEGVMGPDIRNEDMAEGDIETIIQNGKQPMPAFKSKLTAPQITAVAKYVLTLKK